MVKVHIMFAANKTGGKVMSFKSQQDVTDFAKRLAEFSNKKVRVSKDNKKGNGIYFIFDPPKLARY